MISCGGGGGGGGGGAAGASIPANEYTTHNLGGWGGDGWSTDGTAGESSSSAGGQGGVTVQGGTSLSVTGYTYNGQVYPDAASLTRAMKTANAQGQFTIQFTVAGESTPRTARITKTSDGYKIEHQYKAIYYIIDATGTPVPTAIFYYIADGINLSAQTGSNVEGWQCSNGTTYNSGIITGVRGDITLTQIIRATNFNVKPYKPDSATQIGNSNSNTYKLANTTDGFRFDAEVIQGEDPFPAGTTFSWTVNGTPAPSSGYQISILPSNLGTISRRRASATTLSVSCTVVKPGASPQTVAKSIMLYMPYDLPSFEITRDDSTQITDNTTYRIDGIQNMGNPITDAFNAFSAGPMPPGTEYEWYYNGNRMTGLSSNRVELTANNMGFTAGTIPTTQANASEVLITCIAKNQDAENASTNETQVSKEVHIKVWKLTIPDVTASITSAPVIPTNNQSGQPVYKLSGLSGTFQMNAVLQDNTFTDAKYHWQLAKVGGNSYDTTTGTNSTLSINLGDTALRTVLGITEMTFQRTQIALIPFGSNVQ